ncbi:MAG TPA: hypothetical protein VFG50_13150 [Rhodothermales bacterium]|nr:hypothetical protein [Rhodothermales bacterium]
MRTFICLSAFLIPVLLSGCSVTGQQDTTVNLHTGTVGDLRVGDRISSPAVTLRGCDGTRHADMNEYVCRTGPYAGLVIRTRDVDGHSSIFDITIGPQFQGTIEEGVGIGATWNDLEDRLGHGSSCWGSPMYHFDGLTVTLSLDSSHKVDRIMMSDGWAVC